MNGTILFDLQIPLTSKLKPKSQIGYISQKNANKQKNI